MAVYVDNMEAPFGRMKMSHMIADSTEELLAMATAIGVNHKWIQKKGTYEEHFDIPKHKKALAVALGAKAISMMELGRILVNRPGHPLYAVTKLEAYSKAAMKACEEAGEPMFLGIPDAWFDNPHYGCSSGHISQRYLRTERGSACLACGKPLYYLPPGTTEDQLKRILTGDHDGNTKENNLPLL